MYQNRNKRTSGTRSRGALSTSTSPGRKTKLTLRIELLVLVLLALVVVVGYFALLRSQNAPPPELPAFAVGEPVDLGSVEWTVTDVVRGTTVVRRSDGSGSEKAEELHLVTVDVRLTNKSDEPLEVSPQSLSLVDRNGVQIPAATDLMRTRVANDDNLTYGTVNPNSTRRGQVIFIVPFGASDLELEVEDFRMFGSDAGRVDLGL